MAAPTAHSSLGYEPFGAATWRDPFSLYTRLRDEDPVHRSPHGFWVLSRFENVWDAARDTTRFSSAQGLTFINEVEALGLAPTIVMMDPPDHTRYRRLVNRGFTPRRVEELEPRLRRFVRDRIACMCDARHGDFIAEVAAPVPNWVVADYLGVPEADRTMFGRWTHHLVAAGLSGEAPQALAELYAYFTELVARRSREPGDDLVSLLVRANEDGGGVGIEGILGYAFVMIAGGNDTTTGLLGGAAELLTVRRDERRRLIDEPHLIPNAVEEFLRLTSPVQGLTRVTTEPVEFEGTTIDAGERVLLLYAAANRDEREFGPTAERLDVSRTFTRMLTFSSGAHYCLGAAAARLQGRVVLEELLAACPDFVVDAEAGTFADGSFTRRYESLPFMATD